MTADLQSGDLRVRRGGHNPRQVRLAIEYTNLMNLAARSDVISVEALDVQPGWPPEKYLVTYRCRGIAGIEEDGSPIFGNLHQVKMYLPSDYPLREPHLKWMTPIWHPNIDHEVPNHVCTNTAQNYFAGKPLSDLVRAMGEMVQYIRYHAAWVPPYPLDRAAAKWVIEYAEPRGIVSKTKPVDDQPLLRPQRVRLYGAAPARTVEAESRPLEFVASGAPAPIVSGRRRIKLGSAPIGNAARRVVPVESEISGRQPPSTIFPDSEPTIRFSRREPGYPGVTRTPPPSIQRGSGGTIVQRLGGALERIGLRAGRSASTCSECSTPLPKGARFCVHCGAPTAHESVICWKCFDTTLPPHSRYCPRCGASVGAARAGS